MCPIVITAPEAVKGEADLINGLFEEGLSRLHLRKPGWGIDVLEDYLQNIDTRYWDRISLHQHWELTEKGGLGGVHFTEPAWRALKRPLLQEIKPWQTSGHRVSCSVHSMEALRTVAVHCDYILAAPVFESISKPGHKPKFTWDVRDTKGKYMAQTIGLGGIHALNIGQAMAQGFDGVALLGFLWENPERAIKNFKTAQRICKKHDPMY